MISFPMFAHVFSAFLSGNVKMFFLHYYWFSLSTKGDEKLYRDSCDWWMKKNPNEDVQ